ncbi:MAG: hypothetical protein H7122_21680 [Chitinophagaceae bacterium]|nr:hypothetical protein [Chitinophagaceae bacterium]
MEIKFSILYFILLSFIPSVSQIPIDLSRFDKKNGSIVSVRGDILEITWPVGKTEKGRVLLNLKKDKPLFSKISMSKSGQFKEIASQLDPSFILTIGKRTLSPASGGWDAFFDKVPTRPFKSYVVDFEKRNGMVTSAGIQTIVTISEVDAASFKGTIEITFFNGSPLFNIAAVMSTEIDSTAILYDAGLVSKQKAWNNIAWSDTEDDLQTATADLQDTSKNIPVKYRTIIGENEGGSLALFPAPHQYFYPLDEAFNLKFTWYGNNYMKILPGFGIGIRQDPFGDKRFVPWFNAPPKTKQRLSFFCLLSTDKAGSVLEDVKKFTHNDSYTPLPGYKTFQSHFHNEFTMKVVLANTPVPEKPEFVDVFKKTGVNIVHLGEFHGTGHPKGPDEERLKELHALFEQCKRLSDKSFLLLPGEEPNNFYGGHWLDFFPKPVYWIMSRKPDMPFVTSDPRYGTVYRINDKNEMLELLKLENGLAWTAHARTKSSTGYPDLYKNEDFFKSETFMGAAWKSIPADLSIPTLSKRVLNLMDDMSNWGLKKHVIGESDIFTITHENEMYAHLNVNYLQLDKIPNYEDSWQPVLDAIRKGKFFVTTGEVLLPSFSVNGKNAGETSHITKAGQSEILLSVNWTFPLNFAEIVSGDGQQVYRERMNLNDTYAFGNKKFSFKTNLKNRKWVRVEVWDIAANGAFTQQVWLE